jgi:hypothetical protein
MAMKSAAESSRRSEPDAMTRSCFAAPVAGPPCLGLPLPRAMPRRTSKILSKILLKILLGVTELGPGEKLSWSINFC